MNKITALIWLAIMLSSCQNWVSYSSSSEGADLFIEKRSGEVVLISDSLPVYNNPQFGDVHFGYFRLTNDNAFQNLKLGDLGYSLETYERLNIDETPILLFTDCKGVQVVNCPWLIYEIKSNFSLSYISEIFTDGNGEVQIDQLLKDQLLSSDSVMFKDLNSHSFFKLRTDELGLEGKNVISLNCHYSEFDNSTSPFRGEIEVLLFSDSLINLVHFNDSSNDTLSFIKSASPNKDERNHLNSLIDELNQYCKE